MAFNKDVFKTRSLTAVVFVMVMMAGLLVNEYTFVGLFSIIMFGCLYEFSKIIKIIEPRKYLLYLPFAFVYIIFPILLLIDLGENPKYLPAGYSPIFPCAIIFSIWINDTMAYLVGSFIGKTPFSKISPKKTWEGTIGGVVLSMATIAILGKSLTIAHILDWKAWMILAGICGLFGTFGDLIESKFKRMANIKDSGRIMPGHGGFLDRFDSLLLATPFVWVYIKIIL